MTPAFPNWDPLPVNTVMIVSMTGGGGKQKLNLKINYLTRVDAKWILYTHLRVSQRCESGMPEISKWKKKNAHGI